MSFVRTMSYMLMLNKKLGSKAIVAIFYQKCRTSLISELFLFFFFPIIQTYRWLDFPFLVPESDLISKQKHSFPESLRS